MENEHLDLSCVPSAPPLIMAGIENVMSGEYNTIIELVQIWATIQ